MALQRVSWFRVRNGSDGLILSLRSGDSQNLFRMSLNGATEPLTQGTGREAWPTVTASGDVVFERTEAAPTIWSLRPEGGDSERPRRETAPGLTFSVSRDGSKLVFGRLIGGGLGQFVLLDRTSGVETVLATHELGNGGVGSFWAQLSPDGSQAVYRVFGPQTGQFLVSTTGGGPRLVAKLDSGFGLPSDWSVDGKRILGECLRTTEGIWELDPSTGAAHKFAKDPKAELLYPSWSWDEKWMTFMRRSAGKTEIWVAPVRGEGLAGEIEWIRISPQDATGARSRFAPDGASVFYLLDENGNRSLVRQLLSPQKRPMGPPQKLAPIPINAGLTTNSTIGVSEDRVFFNTVEIRGNIWLKSIH
jgi:Tol biopolymer transport system component